MNEDNGIISVNCTPVQSGFKSLSNTLTALGVYNLEKIFRGTVMYAEPSKNCCELKVTTDPLATDT
jgi:hypothetical protein